MNIHELSTYNLADAVKFHRRLNPRIWGRDEHLLPEVREKLLAIAEDFQEFLGVEDLNVKDITISGSNAAYSYTKNSDIDLHIVVEMPDDPVYQELFNAKKYQYNDEHNIKIGGADVELYVQPADQPHISQGIYSVQDNDWISVPRRKRAQIDDVCVRDKVADLDARIHDAVRSGDESKIATLADKIKAMRQAGLEQQGEFGCENLAFKMLRNSGCIKLLWDARRAAQDRELSLREADRPQQRFRYGFSEGHQGQPYSSEDGVAASTKQFLENSESDDNIVQDFIQQVTTELGIDPMPKIHLHTDPKWSEHNQSFGRYDPESHTLNVSMPNRHVMDVLRTVAHELVHCSQNQQHGQLPDDAGETGSDWENDANARAGIIMRDWANSHPEHFAHDSLEEGASGYIPKNKREAAMPQYAMALSVDIKPGQTGKEANKLALNTGRNGEPGLLMKTVNLREYRMPQPSHGPGAIKDLNEPLGPETPPEMPAGTIKVDVSDMYDWYKLGQKISDLDSIQSGELGSGPPSTVFAFGSEDLENMYSHELTKLGLKTHDLDEPGEEDIDESIDADQVLHYVKQTHGADSFDIEYSITDHPQWQLVEMPLSQLNLDPNGEQQDPYNRTNWVDYDVVRDLMPKIEQVLKANPIVVDSDGWIIDGNHRAMAAAEAGLTSVPALVPAEVKENFHNDTAEAKTVEFEGLTLKVIKQDHELMVDALDDWGNKVLGHVKFNIGDGQELDPQDLRVDDKYQGQGIARVMYDYVKSLGYTINRSWDQTDAGAGFWNKHRGQDVRVWENTAAGINKMFNNLGDPVYANLQRVALLAMQGRQQEAAGRLQTVIKDSDPAVQKKIIDAVNNIKPVTINGKIADSSTLDKSKQHNDWIINTFIPWVQSLLGQQGVAESENNDTAISLSKLGKFHPGADTLAEFVPERATAQYALHPDKWESTFYSLTNKDSEKLKYYGPKKISIPPGTLVGDMAIANKFYRAKTPEEQEQYAELYKASLQPYPVDVSEYRMPELLIPRQGVAEARTNPDKNIKRWAGKLDLAAFAENIKDKENWGVSMTVEPKLGINPRVGISEDTPKGIYFYPLEYFIHMVSRYTSLPWGDNMPYMQLFQYDRSGEMTRQTQVDPAQLKQALSQYCPEEIIQQVIDEPDSLYDGTPYWLIYDCLSRLGKSDETNIIRWNKVLRDLGFTSVFDPGRGWIAYGEPTQGVILDPRIIKQHKTFINRNPTILHRKYDINRLADAINWSDYYNNESQRQQVPYGHPDRQKTMLAVANDMLRPFLGKTSEEAKEMGLDQALKTASDKVIEILKQDAVQENFADGKNPGRKEIDPDVYEDLSNGIIARTARQIVPTIRAKSTPEGYVYLSTQDGLSLVIGCNIAGGSIDINIGSQPMETTSSGPHKGAVTKIIEAVYQAAAKQYGAPIKQGTLSIDHDAGHGVWQHIAQKLGLQHDAYMVKENFADGKNPGRKGLAKRSGVDTKASVSSLRKTAKNSSGEKQRMAHWLANMKAGRAKAKRK